MNPERGDMKPMWIISQSNQPPQWVDPINLSFVILLLGDISLIGTTYRLFDGRLCEIQLNLTTYDTWVEIRPIFPILSVAIPTIP